MAVSRLDDSEKLIQALFVSGQNRQVLTVNESGVYGLTFRSRKAEAIRFRLWITSEVLPSIRQRGGYISPGITAGQSAALIDTLLEKEAQIRELKEVNRRFCPPPGNRGSISPRTGLARTIPFRGGHRSPPNVKTAKKPANSIQLELSLTFKIRSVNENVA
jgi:hypothetical protein